MPAPGRGVAVRHVGTVTSVAGTTCQVTVAGIDYRLPCLPGVTPGPAWVDFVGREGLVLGPAAANLCDGLEGQPGSIIVDSPATPDVDGLLIVAPPAGDGQPHQLRLLLVTYDGGSGTGYVSDGPHTVTFPYTPDGSTQSVLVTGLGAFTPTGVWTYQGGAALGACLTYREPT